MSNQEYLSIFKQLFSDKLIQRNNPSILTKETAENIYHLNLAIDSYKIIKKVFKTYLLNSQLENLDLKDMVLYFNNLSCSINTFFLESRILWHEINEIIYLKKDVLQKKDFLKEYFYKKIRNKINSLQEQIIVNVLKILKQKEELKLANEILIFLKEFNVYDHFFGKLSKKNVQILRRENFSEKITKEQKICLIYDLLKKEKKNFFIKKFYKKVETDFLKKYFKIEVEGLFEFEKKSLGKFFRLVEKIKNRKEFYKKMNNFLEKEVDFYDFCCFITKLNNFYEIICQLKLEENFKKELSYEIYFSLENFVLKHEKTFFKRMVEEIKHCDTKYLKIVALFFKICAEKEEFNELLREIFADLLLKQESQKLEFFLKICHKEKVGKNNSFKLENMLNEFKCKKMCKNSEIIAISSVYWPKFENENLNLVELENIKNKFLLEEKRKNPKIKYEFNDLISLCEISFNDSKLECTLLQYKILLLLNEKSMTYKKLKSFFNTTFFDENYDQLLSNQVIIDKSGLLFLTNNKITNQILPNNFPRTDTENEEIQEKTTFLLIDSKIMTIMKKEKKIKEDFLKNMIDEYKLEERIELLIDKGYLKREKKELIYVP